MADNDSFRSFMFSYLEYILESQDTGEVERVKTNIEVCWDTLAEMGVDFPYDELFRQFYELLDSLIERGQAAISAEELLQKCRDPCYSNFIVMFLRCVTASQIYKYRDFYSSSYIDQCASPREMRTLEFDRALDPIGSVLGYPHPAHCAALANALGVPIMVVHLIPASLCDMDDSARHLVNLLCRDGHFDIIYRS
uniref:Ubiquitin thioesterase otubain-like n=1 Tax=Anthurium amnicola TaxID=1678845 RepID=A0A1D1YQ51_9ARAE